MSHGHQMARAKLDFTHGNYLPVWRPNPLHQMRTLLATFVIMLLGGTILAQAYGNSGNDYKGAVGDDLLRYRMMITVKITVANSDRHTHLPTPEHRQYELLLGKAIIDERGWSDVIDFATDHPTAIESAGLIDHVLSNATPAIKARIKELEGRGSRDGLPKRHAHLLGNERREYDGFLKNTHLSDAEAEKVQAFIDKHGDSKEGYVLFDHLVLYGPDGIGNRHSP